jgi:shikimate dehydrogenase
MTYKNSPRIFVTGYMGAATRELAEKIAAELSYEMIDLDAEVIQMAGCSIPEIFAKHGEQTFRSLETAVLSKYGKESGLVIATGGGSVTRPENYAHIHQNGTVFWLTRDLSKLPTEGRPLSQSGKLESMYAIRKPLYDAFSDCVVSNDGTIENTVSEILSYYTL